MCLGECIGDYMNAFLRYFPNHLFLSRLNRNIIDVGCMYSNKDVGLAMNEALVIKFGPMYLKITQDLTICDAFCDCRNNL